MYSDTKGDCSYGYRAVWQTEQRVSIPIVDRVGAPVDIRYKDDTGRLARITWMVGLVVYLPPPANQASLHAYIQWLRTSDVNPPNWNVYDQYCRGEQRWLATHSCYEIASELSPIAVFEMNGRPVDHKAVFMLTSHSPTLPLQGLIWWLLRKP